MVVNSRPMKIEYDELKNQKNIQKHGVSLGYARFMSMDTAVVIPDKKKDYGEERFLAFGSINGRMFSMAFTMRGDTIRIISLRKANTREVSKYEQSK